MTITAEQLKHIAPAITDAHLATYVPLLNKYMPIWEIDTKARIAPFLANLAHESGSFNYTKEIASGAAYEGRVDLGNTHPGDGVKYKGAGLIQITGFNAYKDCSFALFGDNRALLNPSLLQQPDAATQSACWFWKRVKGLNIVADQPDDYTHEFRGKTYNRFEWICFKINGGENGMAERKIFYSRAIEIL